VQVRFQAIGGDEIAAHTKNIGVGGAFIVTPNPPKVGTHLRLMIEMPNTGSTLEVRAEIRWLSTPAAGSSEVGMGVRFAGLDVDQLLALNEYFASLTATVDHD
jgi:uncharacterized protein (TIGR02266 family)